MSDAFAATKGLITVAALFADRESDGKKVIVRGGVHELPKGALAARFVESFPLGQDFSLVIPAERAEPQARKEFPLTVHYKVKLSACDDPWLITEEFWAQRKEDFVRSFLQRLKELHRGGTFIFHLIEEGKLVRAANLARRDAANSVAQGSLFPVEVYGVSSGQHAALDPFDEPET